MSISKNRLIPYSASWKVSECLFWFNGEVTKEFHPYVPTIDTKHGNDDPEMRYGRYSSTYIWDHIPFGNFPKEFRMELLLLGVS